MKKLFLLIAPFLLSLHVSAQKADLRLLQSYSQKEIDEISAIDTETIRMLNYALDNACYIIDAPVGKQAVTGSSIVISDIGQPVCFAEHGLRIEDSNQYIPVSGTSKMLVVKSTYVLKNELKNAVKK
jgi:hypothetical protein